MGNACDCRECCQRQVAFQKDYSTCEYKSYIGFIEYKTINRPYDTSKYWYYKIKNDTCMFTKEEKDYIPIMVKKLIEISLISKEEFFDPNLYEEAENFCNYLSEKYMDKKNMV